MRRNLENIEIVEPPIEELTKKRSWKGACFTSCLFLIIVVVGLIVGIRIYVGAGPKSYSTLPPNFPTDIPVYDKDNIDNITYVSGQYKERGLGIATIIPKLILSPIFYNQENSSQSIKNIFSSISTNQTEYRNSFEIEWRGVNADPEFVTAYYKKELKKKNFKIDVQSSGKNVEQFSFYREDGYNGSIYAQSSDDKKSKTDYMILTINLPKK